MSEKRETYEVTETRERVIAVYCDRCGAEIPETDDFTIHETKVMHRVGMNYPEGGGWQGWEVEDLCDNCTEFLRKLLEDNGFTVKDTEYDW